MFFLRAGLLAFVISYISIFSLAAPLSENALVERENWRAIRRAESPDYLVARHDAGVIESRFVSSEAYGARLPRSILNSEKRQVPLVRRASIFTKIKQGFQKVGNAIKGAAQKVASGVKTAVQKVASGVKTAAKAVGNGIKTAAQKVATGVKTAVQKVGTGIKTAAQKVASGVKTAVKTVGNGIKTAAKKVASGVKTAVKTVGNGIKTAAKKVASGVKTAASKAGKWIKTTGAKIAKFGLEVVSTAASVGSKLAKFIPGLGKPIGAALKAESKITGAVSDAIHVDLGKKLDKGMKVMKMIKDPVGGAAGAVIDALRRETEPTVVFRREYY